MKKEEPETLLASKLTRVVVDQAVPQEMLDEFSHLRSVPYLGKDFEGSSSSETTTEGSGPVPSESAILRTLSDLSHMTQQPNQQFLIFDVATLDWLVAQRLVDPELLARITVYRDGKAVQASAQ